MKLAAIFRWGSILWLFWAQGHGTVFAQIGSCAQYQFPLNAQGQLDWPYPVKVIADQTPVYADATSTAIRENMRLAFNQNLQVVAADVSRVLVNDFTTRFPIGWVERTAVLCRVTPLPDASGLEQWIFLTPDNLTVKLMLTANGLPCSESCPEVRTAFWYSVFAETASAYLISAAARLSETDALLGWVSKTQSVVWSTASGIRPREDFVYPAGSERAGEGRTICAYPGIADAQAKQHCLPVQGGPVWYEQAYRLPVLDTIQQDGTFFYQVLAPNVLGELSAIPETINGWRVVYMPYSEVLSQDIFLTGSQLYTWNLLVNSLNTPSGETGATGRAAFLQRLTTAMRDVVRISVEQQTGRSLRELLQREAGLPVREFSPLFRYSLADLADPEVVPNCEIKRLQQWLRQAQDILTIVTRGDQRPEYRVAEFPGECPSGEDIPYIVGDIRAVPLGSKAAMRYDHPVHSSQIYWVPEEFLP